MTKPAPLFIHLRVHSSYSLLEGGMQIAQLAEIAKKEGAPALALTDRNNLFGALEFSEKMASSGIQPLCGFIINIAASDEASNEMSGSILLLSQSSVGYQNLIKLSSIAFIDTPHEKPPHITLEHLKAHNEGLILLTGGYEGPINRALERGQGDAARQWLADFIHIFADRCYVEIQRHGLESEKATEDALIALAYAEQSPLVATNGVYFAKAQDYEAHDALLAIAEGRTIAEDDRRQLNPEHRFKTMAEMRALFADLPEAIENTIEIAMRCYHRPTTVKPILPVFTDEDEAEALKKQAHAGLAERIKRQGLSNDLSEEDYSARLDFELDVIARMKYAGYFLIVSDFIKWAKSQSIPVGPGRGSGAGSLVAYALMITDLDPIRFGLLFERFLNPERVSMPDFDIDFCQDRRDEVIDYVRKKYGNDRVAQIITFGTLQARGVLRDVGRVLAMPYGQVDRLCKLVPQNPANPVTLSQAIDTEPRLKSEAADPLVRRMLDIALKLEGLHRHASTHAAGIVIGDRPLNELVPLYRDPRSDMPVTQFNMKWVEQAGLVKFDFLGLKTLTVIRETTRLLAERGIYLDIDTIPLDDAPSYAMMARGETAGVFQLESAGMRKALADMKPDRFEDIIALVALYRPGPMANIPTYCARKHGNEQPDYMHEKLEPLLKETFGVIIYQEQVMQIAQLLAGYSLGDADLLRRAMGKKIKAEMAAQRDRFVSGATARGIEAAQADTIFDLLAKFADYGFNKSHAAAYALVAYQTAYLKANYPAEFMAASMTLDAGNTDKLAEFRQEIKRLGLTLLGPDINHSMMAFQPTAQGIRYALPAIKGVGEGAAQAIIDARGKQPFRDIADFSARLDSRHLNKKSLEALAAAGAFDSLEKNRALIFENCEMILRQAQQRALDRASGQNALFAEDASTLHLPAKTPWLPGKRLQAEHDAIGFYLSGHPLEDYTPIIRGLKADVWAGFVESVKRGANAGRLVGSVIDRAERRTKSGSKMGIITLSDPTGQYEAIMFAEGLLQYRDVLAEGQLVLLQVAASLEGEEVRVRIHSAEPLAEAAKRVLGQMTIHTDRAGAIKDIATQLKKGKEGQKDSGKDGKVLLRLAVDDETEAEIILPQRYAINPDIAASLRVIPGVTAVELG